MPASILTAINLRTEYLENPIGCDDPRPRFTWKLQATTAMKKDRGLGQSAYQILVSSSPDGPPDLWDSGKVASQNTSFIEYAGILLKSGQRAWWTVRVWDQKNRPAPPAQTAFWEAGLLDPNDWTAKWICSHLVGGFYTQVQAPFFRKSFQLPRGNAVVGACLYVTALGLYEFRINGQKVGKDVFTPCWTDYRKRVQYQAYDVTPLLKSNRENVLGAILGDGWYCGYTGNINRRQYFGDRPKLLGQLHIRLNDGTTQILATDETWTTATGPILSSDLFMGETYDARLEMPGWDSAGFTPSGAWSPVLLPENPNIPIVAMTGPRVQAMQEITPLSFRQTGAGRQLTQILDLGQNMVGRVRLKVKGPAGTTVKMRFAEMLDDNALPYTQNLRTAQQTDVYTLRGDPRGETYESRFTFHGFRYVSINGYPGEFSLDAITGIVLHSEMEQTGSFECSDASVNQLQHNIQWGQRGNFVDVPTDCPQRDERLGWTGDAQAFVRTAAFNFDVAGFFAKWTQDLRDSQSESGSYPPYAPNNCDGPDQLQPSASDGGPAWADAGIICPWTMYLCYGDRRLLERHYDSMVRFVDSLELAARPFDLIRSHPNWNGWHGFGDWLSQDGKNVFGATPKDLIGTAFFAHDARLLSAIATILKHEEDALRFSKLANDVAAAFCRRFVTAEGLIIGNTQTAYVLALHFNLLPVPLRPAAVDNLVRNIRNNENRLNTGFVGTPYLNHVLSRAGRLDVAYQLLMQKNWPSWLYAVGHDATTVWERWDGWTHDKGFQDPGMNSFNHYAYGAIGDWLYQVLAGIEIDAMQPGYRHVLLQPHIAPSGPLTYARARLETINGPIESGWRVDGKTVKYAVKLPPNVTATLLLPADPKSIKESGKRLVQGNGVEVVKSTSGVPMIKLSSGQYEFAFPTISRE